MIDEYGEGLIPDFWFYYGLDLSFWTDVIEGKGPPPFVVIALAQRLPDDSLTSALANGGRQFFGWGQERFMLADLFDAVNLNTRASGSWAKGKAPKIPEYPRPKKPKQSDAPRKGAVKSLFNRMHGSGKR